MLPVWVLLVTGVLLLGVQAVFEKLSLRRLHYSKFTFLRFSLCALLCFAIYVGVSMMGIEAKASSPAKFKFSDLGEPWLWMSALATAVGGYIYYMLLSRTGAAYMTFTWPAMMVVTVLVSAVFLKEVISLRRGFGMGLALFGSVLALS